MLKTYKRDLMLKLFHSNFLQMTPSQTLVEKKILNLITVKILSDLSLSMPFDHVKGLAEMTIRKGQ